MADRRGGHDDVANADQRLRSVRCRIRLLRKGRGSTYFSSGGAVPCGLSSVGVPVSFYHRTLAEYVDAFLDAGLTLTRIVDIDHPAIAERRARGEDLPLGEQLPRFMVLAFRKP